MASDRLYVLVQPRVANTRYDLATLAQAPNVTLVPVRYSPVGLRQHLVLRRLAHELALDVFHSPSYTLPVLMPCPVVATLHDLIPCVYPQDLPDWRARAAYRALVRLALLRAQRVIVDAEATRQDLLRLGAKADRVVVIPLAADSAFRPYEQAEIAATLGRLGVTPPYALYVGINKPHKNLLGLLRAWRMLSPGVRGEHTLVWAGPQDPRYSQEQQLVRELASEMRVQCLGPVATHDLPLLYAGATCLAFPSLYEGFGLPALEAMACGTPVVCADRSALPEVVGHAALLFDPMDPWGLWAALARTLTDAGLRAEMTARGLARARCFSWERTARATLAVYRELVGTR